MARLLIKSEGFGDQVIELNLGVNHFGRSPNNDFQIDHPTISARHCDIVLGDDSLTVRDHDSTNGTFVDGELVKEAQLRTGQTLHLGDIEFFVETTRVSISIPKIEVERPAPPVVVSDGGLICPRHKNAKVTHQCTHCQEVLCDECVHRLRRRGGKTLMLCPLCSHKCAPIGGAKKQKKSFLGILTQTIKLPFLRRPSKDD